MKFVRVGMLLLLSVAAFAQNAPIPTKTFSFNASPISLPGGRGSFVGTDAGLTFSPTQNFRLESHNVMSSDAKLSSFMGGAHYDLPVLSVKANNTMTNVSGFRMLFGLTALVGIDRVTDPFGAVRQHYSAMGLATFAYDINSSGSWTVGANVGMARFPGFATGWTPVVEVPFQFHF